MITKPIHLSKISAIMGIILLLGLPIYAQETILSEVVEVGGFGGPYVKLTQIDDEFGVLVGGRGGITFNRVFTIGGYGAGRANGNDFSFSHYGGFLEYAFNPMNAVHFSIGVLIGGGDATRRGNSGKFFTLEPEAWVLLNITQSVQLGLGGGYRWVPTVNITGVEKLSGLSGNIIVKFGKY